jgi:type II secretion system protein D
MSSPFPFPAGQLLLLLLLAFQLEDSSLVYAQETGQATNDALVYQNAPVNSILDLYEQLSGKHLIRDPNLSNPGAVQNISLNASGLTGAERLKFIEEALLFDGVAIVPIDDNTAKVVVTLIQAKSPRSEGVKIYANAADLPKNDEVVSYYMTLNYINPQEAFNIFMGSVPPHNYGAYVVAPSAQALVLTDNVGVIRELIALKELIDVPPAEVTNQFIQLNRADAEKVADLLNKLLTPKPAGAPGGPGDVTVPATLGNNQPLSNERNLISGTVQIVADTRSNRLLVVSRPVNMPFLRQMITELDQPDIFMVPQRRSLKYVLAQDILPALEAALAEGKDEQDQAKSGTTGTPGSTSGQQNQQSADNSSNYGGGSGNAGSISAITPQLKAPPENNAPTVVTIGKTRLMADNRSNSIIVFGSPDIVSRVDDMIDQLDRKPLQVYLATVIGQMTVSEGQDFGIDILQKFQHVGSVGLSSSNIGASTVANGSAAVPEPSGLLSSTGFPLFSGLTLYGAIGNTLNYYVHALEQTNRFKVISRPSVYTTNNKLAVIASGSQVPVLSNIASSYAGGTTTGTNSSLVSTGSIQYEDVLLQLDIIPLINSNHDVTLKIRQTNNSLGANNTISGNNVPTINTQEINTEVTVPDKSTVVIGGLISDTQSRDSNGVPWLTDIPILKYLFSTTQKKKEHDELIIMIQPTVVETALDQISANDAEKKRTLLGDEAVEAAHGTAVAPTQSDSLFRTDAKIANPNASSPGSKPSSASSKALEPYSTPVAKPVTQGPSAMP